MENKNKITWWRSWRSIIGYISLIIDSIDYVTGWGSRMVILESFWNWRGVILFGVGVGLILWAIFLDMKKLDKRITWLEKHTSGSYFIEEVPKDERT